MKQYQDLVRQVLNEGDWQTNRTGVRTISIPGASLRFDLKRGFPAVTTKRLAFKSAIGEMIGFLRGYSNAADFRALGSKVWDQNANENAQWLANPFREGVDDMGQVYGVQWRRWPAYKVVHIDGEVATDDRLIAITQAGYEVAALDDGKSVVVYHKEIDQLRQCLDKIVDNPGDRRILFHGWNPAQLDEMALPPCHLLYQFFPNQSKGEMSMTLYIRSSDVGLGLPFNTAAAAMLLELVARLTGYTARWLTIFTGDTHIYENHLEMLQEQLKRDPYESPRLVISDRVPAMRQTGVYDPSWLDKVEPTDFSLEGYVHHPPLTAPMAV